MCQDITGKTPLMKATRNGKLEAVKRLLAAGCSVAVRDRNSDTALHFAARHGNARLLSALIAASAADINMQVSRSGATTENYNCREENRDSVIFQDIVTHPYAISFIGRIVL